MSEDNASIPPPRSRRAVATADFVRFLEAKSPDSDCPVCGSSAWTVVCPYGGEQDVYRLVVQMRDGLRPMTISTFAIFCDSCGYIRQHLARTVQKWAEENPIEPELDFESGPETSEDAQ